MNYDQLMFVQLRGNLLTYEMTILNSQHGENKKKSLALKAFSSHKEEDDDDEKEDDDEETEDEDEEFKLLLKKFNSFIQRKSNNLRHKRKPPKCYECGEVGYIKPNYRKNQKEKKYKKKHKAYVSWENDA
ncbi:hypothetical protein PIB30_101860, partial [Stylosanthes scabra]|nr:hypothetical protein [Stylosanthes scabra]